MLRAGEYLFKRFPKTHGAVADCGGGRGDAPVLVADNAAVRKTLCWTPRRDLANIIGPASN